MMRVCFVCLGNICRSPTAEGVFKHLVHEAGLDHAFTIESAGTGTWFEGEPPDSRSREEALRHGVTLEGKAHHWEASEFDDFDLVIAMDRKNLADLRAVARDEDDLAKIRLMREFLGEPDADVPDPFLGEDGFAAVYQVCEQACRALLDQLRSDGRVLGQEKSE